MKNQIPPDAAIAVLGDQFVASGLFSDSQIREANEQLEMFRAETRYKRVETIDEAFHWLRLERNRKRNFNVEQPL